MLPDAEIERLIQSIQGAIRLAEAGKFCAGYDHLRSGLQHAEESRPLARPYQQSVEVLWMTAVEEYALCYGVGVDAKR
jgi:hypothetical protein